MLLLTKLVLAHLLGDFILQPSSWVKVKENQKHKAWQLYVHILIHGILIMLLVKDWGFLWPCIIVVISHGIIDLTKLIFQKESTKRLWFALDQVLHIAVILSVWSYVEGYVLDISYTDNQNLLLLITSVVFLTIPTSVIIREIISQWKLKPADGQIASNDSLEKAGKFIGILERLFVFTFVLINSWEAIGFLIAAKSVFRFGDLKEGREIKMTEYVLIGTLLSYGIAILTGLLLAGLLHLKQNELLNDLFKSWFA